MPSGQPLSLSPNYYADYNQRYEILSAGEFRYTDQRFERSRAEFAVWAIAVAARYG